MLNYLFLITAIIVVTAALLYLFYWNKLVGLLLGLGLRIAFWNQGEHSIWVEIGSIHFSLVAGRILFKNVRYHSSNQTIKVVKGQVVWRYWIRAPTLEEDFQQGHQSSCRIHASLEGVEWVMYNRTATFDSILSQMDARHTDARGRKSSMDGAASKSSVGVGLEASPYPPASASVIAPTKSSATVRKLLYWLRSQLPNLDPKKLLPFSFQIDKGAIICGNGSTPSLLHAEFTVADGMYGNVQSRSSLDLYKQVLNVKFRNAFINLSENKHFQGSMVSVGAQLHEEMAKTSPVALHTRHYLSYHTFSRIWRHANLDNVMAYLRDIARLRIKSQSTHHGSFRSRRKPAQSLDIETPVGQDFSKLEYAIERTILEAPSLSLSYYTDVAGTVPEDQKPFPYESYDVGNGAASPEWGIDLVIQGGFIRYGPWADRQRAELQRAFFPPTYEDANPTLRLSPGDTRLWTAMRIFVELRGGTTVYIPFREPSKNWQWDGISKVPRPRKREGASLSIKAGDDSTISYLMPMVAGQDGYKPLLEVHLDSVTVSSSLNDIRLVTAESCRIQGDLHSPLKWNAHRVWRFNISLRQPVLYLLRDHINMIADLGKDWSTGPPSNYHTWVPMTYGIDLDMRNYELNLYANDHNIIDKPLLRDENALLTFNGLSLRSEVSIPSGKYRPLSTTITFDVNAPDILVNLTLPKWSTHQLIASEPTTKLGTVGLLRLNGSYLYFSDVRPDNVEQLRLNFMTNEVIFKCLGWSVRHFMILRENYFGGFTHFSTIQEFLERRERGHPMGDPIQAKWREGASNVMNIDLQLTLEKAIFILPAGLRGYETYNPLPDQAPEDVRLGGCVILTVPELQVQLGTHDSALDMSLNIGTMYGSILSDSNRDVYAHNASLIHLSGINIVADRLFGPQPHTTTYVCIWDVSLGDIQGSLSFIEASIADAALNTLAANFKDPFNVPAAEFALPVDPDVTFLKVSLGAIDLIWETDRAAVQISLPEGLSIDMNDLAGKTYRKVTSLRLPKAMCRLLQRPLGRDRWVEVAEVVLDTAVDIYGCPPQWSKSASDQAHFLMKEDGSTGRLRQLMLTTRSASILTSGPAGSYSCSAMPPTHHSRPSQGNSITTRPLPFSRRANYASDSDGEDALNDSDRDIRLANSRPPSVMPVILADNESLDTGDESDNADLTDDDRSESDWSQPADGKSFFCHRIGKPSQWWSSPFSALRVRDIQSLLNDRRPLVPPRVQSYDDDDDDCDSTTLRIRAESVSIWLTPLLPQAMVHMLHDMYNAPPSPERRIDSLLTDHIKAALPSVAGMNSQVFHIECGTTRVQLVQFIPEESKVSSSSSLRGILPPEITTVDLLFYDLDVKGQSVEHSEGSCASYIASLGMLEAHLGAGRRTKVGQTKYQDQSASKMSLTHVECSMGAKRMSASWVDFAIVLDHNAGHRLLDALVPYRRPVLHALDISRSWKDSVQQNGHQRVLQLLQWSSQHTVVDPLSTIQPSYLIQSGRPHALRVSAISKLLVHLRTCLQTMDPEKRQAICTSQADGVIAISGEDVATLLIGQLVGLAVDADMATVAVSQLLAKLFPSLTSLVREQTSSGYPVEAAEFGYRSLHLTILDPDEGSPCHITLRRFRLSFRLQKPDLIHQAAPSSATKDPVGGRDRARAKYQHVAVSLSLDSIDILVLPHLLYFAQHSVSLRGRLCDLLPPPKSSSPTIVSASLETIYGEVTMTLGRLRVQVAEEKLVLVYEVLRMGLASCALLKQSTNLQNRLEYSLNTSLMFDSMTFAAHSFIGHELRFYQDVLAGISIEQGKLNGVIRQEPSLNPTIRAVVTLGKLSLSVPRSVIRLLKFLEEWRADYLPAIEQTIHTLMKEMQASPMSNPKPPSSTPQRSTATLTVHLQLTMPSFGVSLHVMPGTWVSWELLDVITYGKSGLTGTRRPSRSFGLRVGSQRIGVSAADISRPGSPTSDKFSLRLPSISLTGYHENHGVHILACVGLFQTKVKPSHWDTLLSLQQKFGQDFDDLVHVLADIRNKRPSPTRSKPENRSGSPIHLHSAVLKVKGFRIGLEGRSSTALFECQDIHGGYGAGGNDTWTMTVLGMSLSLASRANASRKAVASTSNYRSAFVVIDFRLKLGQKPVGEKEFHFVVEKIHGVLQPSSIGEIGDFVDHLQAEVLVRQDERARALAEFKEKTREVMRSFEGGRRNEDQPKNQPWFTNYSLKFTVRHIGAAFPLALDGKLELPRGRIPHEAPVRAFLFSIKSLEFGAERNGSGQFTMESFSFQFVDRFRQSVPADFLGDSHKTRNRMVYPEMTAHIRSEQTATSRLIRIQANVSGFILDLDPSIADHIFSLVDVYRQGKERVSRLASNARPPLDSKSKINSTVTDTQYSALPTSNIYLSLVFLSGTLHMYSGATSAPSRTSSLHELAELRASSSYAETFTLPVVSLWGEYRATPASQKIIGSQDLQPSTLMFKTTVHSSKNTLRPTLLPFISELVGKVETRMRKASLHTPNTPSVTSSARDVLTSPPAAAVRDGENTVSSMQITFALRIDQSKLELTCQPDVNVIAGVHWDSGGFLLNISSGARQVSFMANVSGLTIGLKHGFLSEDCVRLDARNLTFSITFAKVDQGAKNLSSVSVVLDTEVAGGLRFSRLQDVLCFKAVWLDRIPVFSAETSPEVFQRPSLSSPGPPTAKQDLTTIVLIRVRRVGLDADLGQSISNLRLDLEDAIFRTKLEDDVTEVSLNVGELRVSATGNMSGKAHIPDFAFRTVRRKNVASAGNSEMLELYLTSGTLDLMLESDYQKILQLWSQPLIIAVTDDWSHMSSHLAPLDRFLCLNFTVSGTDVIIVGTVSTIPKLMSYGSRFKSNLESQREGARRESEAFRIAQTPNPDNPLSAVANAMLQSARSKLKEAEDNVSHVIQQQMDFRLDSLRLVVFPRSMNDYEMAHFGVRDIRAQLHRSVEVDGQPAKRKLHLAFSSMSTSRVSQLNHSPTETVSDVGKWLDVLRKGASSATIFDLPSMDMSMDSEEVGKDTKKTLEYDFYSKFLRRGGPRTQDDIFITLNVSLYSWLTLLRKNLAREMDQVQAAGDWRTSMTPATAASPRRKTLVDGSPPPESVLRDGASPTSLVRGPSLSVNTRVAPPSSSSISREHKRAYSSSQASLASQTSPGAATSSTTGPSKTNGMEYRHRDRVIERLNMRQLGEATPDVMHPFFMKKAGFSLEDSLPQYVHEYATMPIEQITQALLKLYSKQLGATADV
ncbi:hypothetical protein OF83DRAFT_1165342 [Amylostereum chailletii]|nr:hypothetical protein OF83DRAFT_1165342 [Amylostereum chailletii]